MSEAETAGLIACFKEVRLAANAAGFHTDNPSVQAALVRFAASLAVVQLVVAPAERLVDYVREFVRKRDWS